ncbi:MAG: hypothetical protein AAGC97_04320 [Planctomycetota bacterium]
MTALLSIHSTHRSLGITIVLVMAVLGLDIRSSSAQTDRLFPKDGEMVLGKIKNISKGGVILTVAGKDQTFAAGTIEKILFQGDPAELTNGRESALDGQYEQAIGTLRTVDVGKLPRDVIKADLQYYLTLAQAEQALAGRGDLSAAANAALGFVRAQADSWRFYDIAKLLGDLAAATGNYDQALKYYAALARAPSGEMKLRSVYESAIVKFAQGDFEAAKTAFEKVAGVKNVTSPEAVRLRNLSKAGLAAASAQDGDVDAAKRLIDEMIETLDPADTEVAARVYNAQGATMEAQGDDEGAVLAYLHTHLMFSSDAQSHVRALKRLAELWVKVGKPDRAAQARGELQQRYPGLSG